MFSALAKDGPGFVVWAAAIVAVGAIGFVPALKPFSRALLVLIVLVIVLNNYQAILNGFSAVAQPSGGVQVKSPSKSSGSSDPFSSIGDLLSHFDPSSLVSDPTSSGDSAATGGG